MMKVELIRGGEKIIYYTGFLAKDRVPEFSKLKRHEALELDLFAKQLHSAYKKGEGTLTQRKLAKNSYAYLFIKKQNPQKNYY
jgi:hypothetical protein